MSGNRALPAALKARADVLLTGVSRKAIADRAEVVSARYRGGESSMAAIATQDDALAYVVARLPATYAVAAAVLDQVHTSVPDFAPVSMLDVGAGPATASWAALETWPSIAQLTLTDSNPHFLEIARALSPREDARLLGSDLLRDTLPQADLVIASFVLAEIAPATQCDAIDTLYAAAAEVLVLIEPGTPAGFERLRVARTRLIGGGAHILGPCTHANICPIVAPDWCHFSQRLPRSRDHMQAKRATVPYEDERYAWLAVSRQRRSAFEGSARVIAPPKEAKPGMTFKRCASGGMEDQFIARRDKDSYARLRRTRWGDVI